MKHPIIEQTKITVRLWLRLIAIALMCYLSLFVPELNIAWAIGCFIYAFIAMALIEMIVTYYFGKYEQR